MTLTEWTLNRVRILRDEGASPSFVRGYRDSANGLRASADDLSGEPYALDDYFAGYALAESEIGIPDYLQQGLAA